MALTGKTGADAIFIGLKHICRVISAYNLKLRTVNDEALAAGAITTGQHTSINSFIDGASVFCAVFEALAAYSGF